MTKPLLLASVATPEEALLAHELGADLLDFKDPRHGALGAWDPAALKEAVGRLPEGARTSATTGDLPMDAALLLPAALAIAASGVDFVKVGFFGGEGQAACAQALGGLAGRGIRLVAVLMADREPDPALVPDLAEAGFAGAMLDTADKGRGGLLAHRRLDELGGFVRLVRGHGLLCGLAGSLGLADIAPLAALGPDYLGFRGALCRGSARTADLDPDRFREVRQALRVASREATATAGKQVATAG